VIEKAQREQLLRFYRDWYRPDLMAVIVVGDVDRDATVAMIKAHFSSLTSPARSARGRRSTCPSGRARATA
jgi:zinc protease